MLRPQLLAIVADPILSITLERSLTRRSFGYVAVEASRIDSADLTDWNEGFDVVLVDVPQGGSASALAAIRRLRAAGANQPVAVLVRPADAAAFEGADGIARVLLKPIDLDELAFELTALMKQERRAVTVA